MRCFNIQNLPWHSISYNIECAPIEDSDQPAHPSSLSSLCRALHSIGSQGTKEPKHLQADCEDSDQIWLRGYKTFFMLNSAEHEIFSANKYENANNNWHFHIY